MFGIGIVIYLFLAGTGAGLHIVSYLMSRFCSPAERRPRDLSLLFQKAQIVSLLLVGVGALFLLGDIARPERFYLVFRKFGVSILSLGALLIVALMTCMGARIALLWTPGRTVRVLLSAINVASVAFAAGVIVYTGVFLMQMQAVPFWGSWIVVALFAVSSLSGGLALFALLALTALRRGSLPRPVTLALKLDGAAMVLEAALLALYLAWGLNNSPATHDSCTSLLFGDLAWAFWTLVCAGLAFPLAVGFVQRNRMGLPLIAGCGGTLLGCFLLRYCIMSAAVRVFSLG